jgi:hypothetical protein
MNARELSTRLNNARGPYAPGVPKDHKNDSQILVGLIDGLCGDEPMDGDPIPHLEGLRIGNELRKALAK